MKKKRKTWTHPRGDINKARILDLLKSQRGLRLKEIIDKTGLSKPAVSDKLHMLLHEHKISKLNKIYFLEVDDDFIFGYFFSEYINFFLTNIMEKKEKVSIMMNAPNRPKTRF